MKSAGKKWRDFKNLLKKKYFKDNLSVEENIANGCGARIPRDEWEWLVKYWSEERTKEIAKNNKDKRENQVGVLHTCGSRSYAVVNDILEEELGRPASRGELYIVTHIKKDGKPLNKQCEEKIDQIKDKINENPDLLRKSIEDGDLYDEIFPREKKTKRITGLGLLPGPKTLVLASTVRTVRQMEEENAEVKARLEKISSEYKSYKEYAERRFERSDQQFGELKALILSLQGSKTGAQLVGPALDPKDVAAEKSPQLESSSSENIRLQVSNDNPPVAMTKVHKKHQGQSAKGAALCAPAEKHLEGTRDDQGVAAPPARQQKEQQLGNNGNKVPGGEIYLRRVRKPPQRQAQVGMEVALRSPTGTNILALGRLQSTDKTAEGGDGLYSGDLYEVLIDVVLDKNCVLPRVEGGSLQLASAVGRCILWPRQFILQPDGSALHMRNCGTDN